MTGATAPNNRGFLFPLKCAVNQSFNVILLKLKISRQTWRTESTDRSKRVFVKSEAFSQSVRSHFLVKDI